MLIYHVAETDQWRQAQESGHYAQSTRGVTLAQQGFIHASTRDQVPGILALLYAEFGPELVLLTIDTDKLDVPWRWDEVADSPQLYPHVYGPLAVEAVVATEPVVRQR